MIRTIIHINEDRCDGCGLCAEACHEGAIGLINGKARLLRDDYCDGLGDCLPACPTNAISFVEREAQQYNEAAVITHKLLSLKKFDIMAPHSGCPGQEPKSLSQKEKDNLDQHISVSSQLNQWPCQIKLMPLHAPYYQQSHLLVAADCTAFACPTFHQDYMMGKVTIIGCPKLDDVFYAEKLTALLRDNDILSLTIVRMDVPCCGGLQFACEQALHDSGKDIPFNVFTLTTSGALIDHK